MTSKKKVFTRKDNTAPTKTILNPFFAQVRDKDIVQPKNRRKDVRINVTIKDSNDNPVGVYVKKNVSKWQDDGAFIRFRVEEFESFVNLDFSSQRILLYIVKELKMNKFEIEINAKILKNLFNLSSITQIQRGVAGLVKAEFIARRKGRDPIYFINPIKFYKGSIVSTYFKFMANGGMSFMKNDSFSQELKIM